MIDYLRLLCVTSPEGEGDTGTGEGVTEGSGTEPEQPIAEPTTEPVQTEPIVPSEYEIDGEKFTAEQIREWKQSGLRQADYTRKTQEVAQQRKEAQDAIELMNFLKENPELVELMNERFEGKQSDFTKKTETLNPALERVERLESELRIRQIDADLQSILSKDKMVTDMDLLQIANEERVTIPKAYELWKGRNFDKILEQKISQTKQTLADELAKNKKGTTTIIKDTDGVTNVDLGLSEQEKVFAEKLGMTYEDYAKYKNPIGF